MNLTPNSFSDGGLIQGRESFQARVSSFSNVMALDIGAESTAPMNEKISADEEWERLLPFLDLIKNLKVTVSLDTYHPETIFKLKKIWVDEKIKTPLIWNDVSGKFDHFVKEFLKSSDHFQYIFCHNLAPTREQSGEHMNFLSPHTGDALLEELVTRFSQVQSSQVIIDPTFGFSKTYEQNWFLLEHFPRLMEALPHHEFLLGISRKSFLRKKLQTSSNKTLDEFHNKFLKELGPKIPRPLWIRAHQAIS